MAHRAWAERLRLPFFSSPSVWPIPPAAGSSSAVNGGPEDAAIRVVEKLGGQCRRSPDFADTFRPAWLQEVVGDPVVEVDLQNLHRKHVADQTLRRAWIRP